MNTMTIVFYAILFFFFVYIAAFEYARYKMALMMAHGLGGKAVYKMRGSFMKRDHEGVEERVWVKPDDRMAYGSLWGIVRPPAAVLFVQRRLDPGFRFRIAPRVNVLFQPMRLSGLKTADFNVPMLDEVLTLRVDNPAEATDYFLPQERQEALVALFSTGFTELAADRNGILATRGRVTEKDLNPERIDLCLGHLRAF